MLTTDQFPQYDGKDIEGFEEGIQESLHEWIQYVEKHGVSYPGNSCKEFEIGRSTQYLVTDMICRLCFGKPFGFVASHADCHDFLKTLEERLPIVEKFSIYTEISKLLSLVSYVPWLKHILPSADDQNGIGKIIGVKIFGALTFDQASYPNELGRYPVKSSTSDLRKESTRRMIC